MQLEERIARYLEKCPPAVSGSDGHGQTFRVACALVNGFALGQEEAFRHLSIYNAGCLPPWKPRELRHKIEQAGKVAHEKPRGHLLGEPSGEEKTSRGREPKPVPVRQKAESTILGRLGRSPIPLGSNAGAHTHIIQLRKVCSVPSVPDDEAARIVASTGPQASQASQTLEPITSPSVSVMPTSLEDDGMVVVPGCCVRRPVEIEMADGDWRALEASGFAEEPMVQLAAWMFGPGCRVVETEVAR